MKRLLKRLMYFLLGLVLLAVLGMMGGALYFNHFWFKDRPNYLSAQGPYQAIPFSWVESQYGPHHEAHDAITMPVSIEGLPHKFYLQFDTGSPFSYIQTSAIPSLAALGRAYEDSLIDKALYLKEVTLNLAGNELNFSLLRVLNEGQNWDIADTINPIRLGTIGADLLADRVSIIDFAGQKLHLFDERPSEMQGLTFSDFDFQGRRFMLPAVIDDEPVELFYDSGSSAFGLLTSKNRFDAYTDPAEPEITYDANSHGNSIPVFHRRSDEEMIIGGKTLSLKRISYVQWNDEWQGFFSRFSSIGGWMGNKPFTESALVLDTKTGEFAVAPAPLPF